MALDLALGEPPERWHPVVWIGRAAAWFEARAPQRRPVAQVAWGALTTAVVVVGAALAGRAVERAARCLPAPLSWLVLGLALKPLLSIRALDAAAERVRRALAADDLPATRGALRWLVSRDTSELDAPRLAAAAIESVAENLSDAFVAPLLAYAVAGLPGACAYRAANTLDSMLGYRGRYEWLGKVPARLDDLMNLVPARLSATLLALAAPAAGSAPGAVARRAIADAGTTASPNAGWPMAAMAAALGVELEKRGHYRLNAGARLPQADDISRARRLLQVAATLALVVALAVGRRYPR